MKEQFQPYSLFVSCQVREHETESPACGDPRRNILGQTFYIRGTTSMMVNEASPVSNSSVLPLGFKYVSGCNRYTGGRSRNV